MDYLWYVEWRLAKSGDRPLLRKSLGKRLSGAYENFYDWISDTAFYVGQRVFHACTPQRFHRGSNFVSATLNLAVWLTFFYMAAEYPRYLRAIVGSTEQVSTDEAWRFGPRGMVDWVVSRGV